jgi:hypothetical protein
MPLLQQLETQEYACSYVITQTGTVILSAYLHLSYLARQILWTHIRQRGSRLHQLAADLEYQVSGNLNTPLLDQ